MSNVALGVFAHPDDAEFLVAGTLIRLVREHGWHVHIASMTPGDCGSAELPAEEISRIRRGEGAAAARILGATYHCLEERDLLVCYAKEPLRKVTHLLRQVRPRIVFTHSPADYMLDHEMTSGLTRAACFNAGVPNFLPEPNLPACPAIPHLYYADPVEGKDPMGRDIAPAFRIDISQAIDTKADMLAAHASQREWLRKHHGVDHYIISMKEWGRKQGAAMGVAYAEGFRQHLGHSYPQDNLLGELLGK
jgi:LmbE family N-acetylglucosaminyl deacetylase